MCTEEQNSKEKEKKKEKVSEKEKSPIRFVLVIISIIFSMTMAFLIVWPIVQRKPNAREVEVVLQIPQDSLAASLALCNSAEQLEVLIDELNQQSQEITNKYELLIKSQETESDFFRLVSCIAAFVVTLLGFLGYRTIKDIEAKAQSIAADASEDAAKEYTKDHLERTVATKLKDFVNDSTVAKLIKTQIMNDVNSTVISPFESRISALESKSENSIEYEFVPTEQPTKSAFDQLGTEIVKLNEEGGPNNE